MVSLTLTREETGGEPRSLEPSPGRACMTPVLVVDDEAAVRDVVSLALRKRGYPVTTAQDGAECLERARAGFRGVILMDVVMPRLTGWQTISALEQDDLLNGSAVCMLTGLTEPGEEGAEQAGMVFDYLTKPFNDTSLLEMVEKAGEILAG
jgi:CheY-like chemotaxis protein